MFRPSQDSFLRQNSITESAQLLHSWLRAANLELAEDLDSPEWIEIQQLLRGLRLIAAGGDLQVFNPPSIAPNLPLSADTNLALLVSALSKLKALTPGRCSHENTMQILIALPQVCPAAAWAAKDGQPAKAQQLFNERCIKPVEKLESTWLGSDNAIAIRGLAQLGLALDAARVSTLPEAKQILPAIEIAVADLSFVGQPAFASIHELPELPGLAAPLMPTEWVLELNEEEVHLYAWPHFGISNHQVALADGFELSCPLSSLASSLGARDELKATHISSWLQKICQVSDLLALFRQLRQTKIQSLQLIYWSYDFELSDEVPQAAGLWLELQPAPPHTPRLQLGLASATFFDTLGRARPIPNR